MTTPKFPYRIINLPETGSTNEYAAALLKQEAVEEFTVIRALAQTAGKGQKGSSWESEAGKNLTFTLVTRPVFVPLEKHFYLSIAASLAVTDALQKFLPQILVKWPNDFFAEGGKLGGLLIENSLVQNRFRESLIGIGVNINQEVFRSDAPNPVSLHTLTGKDHSPDECLQGILACYLKRYEQLRAGYFSFLLEDYYSRLLGYNFWMNYETPGKKFRARIQGVRDTGELMLEHKSGVVEDFSFKEVTLLPD
jgi:BirA family transcriptional regulator, biotin operon repressor / biotin---[acetyl-CoA-carboxylase] ligase